MKKVFSLLLALLMVLSLMPQFALPAKAAVELEKLQYDDHVDLSGYAVRIVDAGIDQSSGKAVVTLLDNELIATGIGTARVSVGGVIHTVTVTKAKLNLIMIMGQSNSGNHFENATSDVTCPAGTAYWWGNEQGTAAAEPVPYTQPSMGFHAPLLAELYAQSVAAGAPVKNVLIWQEGITSKDGQSITKWARSATDTSGTNDAVTMLENCRRYYQSHSDRYEIVSSGVYWLQGETDTSMDPALYTQRFMAMWKRLKNAGMEYLAFLRVRRNVGDVPVNKDDLSYSSSLSAQIKMINDNPEFYMATTLTENWTGLTDATHTVDISNYITMLQTYGKSSAYSDQYGNTATYSNGKLTTAMKYLYGSNNDCHYGKFGYGLIGADAAYHMYRALNADDAAVVITDTSGHADRSQTLKNGQTMDLDISSKTDNLSFRTACGSTAGTLKLIVRSGTADITDKSGVVIGSGNHYGALSTSVLRGYQNVSVYLTYTAANGAVHTAVCNLHNGSYQPKQDYIWDFDKDLNARSADGEVLNSFVGTALAGSYSVSGGYLNATGLQLQLENAIELDATKDWSIEWKYGALTNGTAGFLLCEDKGNTVGNRALWHTEKGNFTIADYLNSNGYYNYTSADVILKANDQLKLTNSYDPSSGKCTVSLWVNGVLKIADFQLKGSINGFDDKLDMTDYPLIPDFTFRYLGNGGLKSWYVNCQLDYLKISFGETCTHSYSAEITKPADCETEGIRTYTCADCGDSYTEKIPATGHSYSSHVTAPTCTAQGYTTYTCSVCGDRYTGNTTAATGHRYSSHVTAPTCTAQGYTTYTCSACGDSYTANTTPANGHRYSGSACTVCGAANPDYVASYYLVGYINGADYGCESDWQNMGEYQFVNGKLVATFTQDSYVFLKREGNTDWYMTAAYCTDTTAVFYSTNTGTTEKMFIPGNVQITFTLVENPDGSLSLSYQAAAAAVTKPVLTLKSPTLEFKDMICIVAFYTAQNTQDVVEMGMITYGSKVSSWSVETADYVIPGASLDAASGRYYSNSQGIHAKYLADTVYLACYAKLKDGSYVYTKLAPYSPITYATNQLKNSTDGKLKQLVAAMLNYGAAAQQFFGHNEANLANAAMTAAQQQLPEPYRQDMVSAVSSVSALKQGSFASNSGFSKRYPAISFEGAFCINYFFTPQYAPVSGITLYYWNAADYERSSVLNTANATGTLKLSGSGVGEYRGDITGIAAKSLSDAVYVAATYQDSSGTVRTSGVLGYSIGAYCASQATKGGDIAALAMATAVYGYHAKQYFG